MITEMLGHKRSIGWTIASLILFCGAVYLLSYWFQVHWLKTTAIVALLELSKNCDLASRNKI